MSCLDFISLRRNCTNRLVKSNGPTPSDDAFLLSDFTSPLFIQKFLDNFQSSISIDNTDSPLMNMLRIIESGFETLQNEIQQIKNTLISRANRLFGQDRHSIEIECLKSELKGLHQKVLDSKMDPGTLEEFAIMFNHFKEKLATPPKPISLSLVIRYQEILSEIEADMKAATSLCSIKSMKEIVSMPELSVDQGSPKIKSYKLKDLFHDNNRNLQGCWLELESKTSLLLFGYDRKVGSEPLQAKLYAVEKGKLCYSIPNQDRLPHAYSRKLNCLAFCYPRYDGTSKSLVIDLHKITTCRVKKITELSIKLDPTEKVTFGESPLLNNCHLIKMSDVKVIFLDQYGLILVKLAHRILVINLFTRKLLYERDYPEGVLDINYIKNFDCVVILTTKEILIYKIKNRDYSFAQSYSLTIAEDDNCLFSSGRTFVENNIILASLNQTYKTEPHSPCFVLEICEPKIKHSRFLVLSPLQYVPVIQPAENKIILFGVLPWLGFPIRKTFTYYLKDGYLKEEQGHGFTDQKDIIYADNWRTIVQKKLESGAKKIIYGTRETVIQRYN